MEQYGPAAQLYLGADMPREAVDCFIAADDWGRARRLAKEIDPTMALLAHVDKQQKNQLKSEGRADQLADIGKYLYIL